MPADDDHSDAHWDPHRDPHRDPHPDHDRTGPDVGPRDADAPAPTSDGEDASRGDVAPDLPKRIGPWTLVARLNGGGMGEVFKARRTDRDHWIVALKVARSDTSAGHEDALRHDAEVLMSLHGRKHICGIVDFGTFVDLDGRRRSYYAMEHVRGARSLLEYCKQRRLSYAARVELLRDACEAMDRVHARGVLHLDLKPDNMLVDDEGALRITDFGLARVLVNDDTRRPGGTEVYMAPEQREGDPQALGRAADVYALGVVAHRLLGGIAPNDADRNSKGPPPLLASPVRKALRLDPQARWRTAGAFGRALSARARLWQGRWALLTGGLGGAVLLAVILAMLVGVPLVYRWTPMHAAWSRAVGPSGGGGDGAWEGVALVMFDLETTPFGSLAEEAGLEGFRWDPEAPDAVTLRRLHAAMCDHLLDSGARAVVFDIYFASVTPHDETFAAALRRLREASIGVVVGEQRWSRRADGTPEVAPALLAAGAETGCVTVFADLSGAAFVPLLAPRNDLSEAPRGLAFAAFLAGRSPGANASARFLEDEETIEIEHWRPDAGRPGGRIRLAPPERFGGFDIGRYQPEGTALMEGVLPGALVPQLRIAGYEATAARAVILDYADVFGAPPAALRSMLGGRIAVIAQRKYVAIGEQFWLDPVIQGEAIERLLRSDRRIESAGVWQRNLAWIGGSAVFGVFAPVVAAWGMSRAGRDRGAIGITFGTACLLLAGALAAAGIAWILFRGNGTLMDPSLASLSMLAAGALALAMVLYMRPFAHPFAERNP